MDYPQDPRTVNILGGFGPNREPLPITRESMVEVSEKWPVSEHTPEAVAQQLRVSRDLYVHCLLVWEFGAVGVAWSLMAVESCLRWALDANDEKVGFARLIERARNEALVSADLAGGLDIGRQLRNGFSHPRLQPVWTLGMTAPALRTSHRAVHEVCEAVAARNNATSGADG